MREQQQGRGSGAGAGGADSATEPETAGPGRDKAGRGTGRRGRARRGGKGRAASPGGARCPLRPSQGRGAEPPPRPPPSLSPGRLPPQRWLPAASGAEAEWGAGDAMGVGEEMAAAAARRPPGLLSRSRSSQPTAPMTAQAARSSQHGHRPQPAPHSASQPPAAPTHRSMPGPRPARRTPAAPARPQGRYLGGLAASTSSAPRPPRARPRQTRRRLRPALTGLRSRPGPHRDRGSARPPLPGTGERPGRPRVAGRLCSGRTRGKLRAAAPAGRREGGREGRHCPRPGQAGRV